MPEWLGKTIGKVRIERLLARGGMAEVYLGTHLTLERPVAIKLLHSYVEEEPSLRDRFHREAKVVAGLRHPNIVQVFDFDTTDGHPYIVMEYFKGPTLAVYLRHLQQQKKHLSFDQVARLLKDLAAALDYAHGQGVIHRDIKPGNILLHTKKDEIPLDEPLSADVEAIVADFGLVRVMNTTSHTTSGTLSGTPAYMSPEQARGDPLDHRTDIYSLGVVLYELLAGHVPFEADNTLAILHMHINTPPPSIPGIPSKVQTVVDRALQKNPDDRYQISREIADDFNRSIGTAMQAEGKRLANSANPVKIDGHRKAAARLPNPARSQTWIRVGLFSLISLSILAVSSWLLSVGKNMPKPTKTAGSPVITNTVASPLPSGTPSLIPSTQAPGIGSTIVSNKDSMTLLYVPAGTFTMGSDNGNADEKPAHTVSLDAFWIDRTEVTNAMYVACVQDGKCNPPASTKSATHASYYGNPLFDDYPVIAVSWNDAQAYCSWANRRLPTEAEWEKAARGTDGRIYPWEDNLPSNNLLNYNNTMGDTTEVGQYPDGKSPYGALDMAGNVWEWVSDWYDANYYTTLGNNVSNPQGPSGGRYHVLRGGSWFYSGDFVRSSSRGGNFPAYLPTSIGFRCAMRASP